MEIILYHIKVPSICIEGGDNEYACIVSNIDIS